MKTDDIVQLLDGFLLRLPQFDSEDCKLIILGADLRKEFDEIRLRVQLAPADYDGYANAGNLFEEWAKDCGGQVERYSCKLDSGETYSELYFEEDGIKWLIVL